MHLARPATIFIALAMTCAAVPAWADAKAPAPAPVPDKADAKDPKKEEAANHFFRGVELYGEADFAGALVEFRRAYDISPDWHLLYNLGQACFQSSNYACALDSFQKYLVQGAKDIKADRKKDVETDIAKLKQRVAKVEITSNVPDVEISIDDEKVGATPLPDAITVSQGKRKFTAKKEGRDAETRVMDVAGGDTLKVEFTLKETEVAKPPPPPPPKMKKNWVPAIVGWSATGVLAAGAVVTGVLALGASSDATNKLGTLGSKSSDITDAESSAKTFALVSDILTGAAIIAGGVSIYLTISTKPKPVQGALPPSTRIMMTPRGLAIVGAF